MKLLNCKTSLALSALTVLKLGTAITADAPVYYIPYGTVVASEQRPSIESNSEADPGSGEPEPPARRGTGGSRQRASLGKFDTINMSKLQLVFLPFERLPAVTGFLSANDTKIALA